MQVNSDLDYRGPNERNTKERKLNMETLDIHIEAHVESYKKLVELVKVIREIQKEHRCNCTLSVEIGH